MVWNTPASIWMPALKLAPLDLNSQMPLLSVAALTCAGVLKVFARQFEKRVDAASASLDKAGDGVFAADSIADLPAVLQSASGAVLAQAFVDNTVLVVRAAATPLSTVREAVSALDPRAVLWRQIAGVIVHQVNSLRFQSLDSGDVDRQDEPAPEV